MGRIARSTVDEVQERLDAIAVVEEYVRLEKRGGRYWGRCPFHSGGQERTPSMTVDPDKKLFHCFGCGKGGGIVGFVMEMDKTDFPETVKTLARKFGVEIVYEDAGNRDAAELEAEHSRKEQLLELYRRTAGTFSHFLLERPEGKPALDYLLSRKIDMGAIKRFRLGYAPAERDWLYRFLSAKGYSGEFLDGSGLFSDKYRGAAFFRDRLMFPISDRQGRTVAFGGRTLPGAARSDGAEPPKYVNSRETDAYRKSRILYGLDLALPEIRRTGTVYVAEGYMDVMALHAAGVSNAVAPCGTAFTDEQAKLLRNWTDAAVLVFDSDEAGLKAADKTIVTCRKNGIACSLAVLEGDGEGDGPKDPAEILQKFGADALKKAMGNVKLDFEYLVARGKKLYDTSIPQGKADALTVLYPYLDALGSRTELDACLESAADAFRADRDAVKADYGRRRKSGESLADGSGAAAGDVSRADKPIRMNDELYLLTLVSVNTNLYPEFRASVGMREIEDPVAKELFVALEECFMNGETGTEALLPRVSWERLRAFVVEKGLSREFGNDGSCAPERLMRDGVKRIRAKKLRRRLSEIGGELRMMERNSGTDDGSVFDGGDFQDLIAEKMQLDAEIRKLEGK